MCGLLVRTTWMCRGSARKVLKELKHGGHAADPCFLIPVFVTLDLLCWFVLMATLLCFAGAFTFGHRIFHHRVCVKGRRYSMWVNRELRRDGLGNPSKLGIGVFKRMAKCEPPPRLATLCGILFFLCG